MLEHALSTTAAADSMLLHRKQCRSCSAHAAAVLLLLRTCTCVALQGANSGHSSSQSSRTDSQPLPPILVVGSVNVDLIMEVHRLPEKGETTVSRNPQLKVAVGGKGANQAVAAARLTQGSNRTVRFVCRFGNDSYAYLLEQELVSNNVDVTGCQKVTDMPSGYGMVMLEPDGAASSVVLGGANTAWKKNEAMLDLVAGAGAVLLQREIPEHVNLVVAAAAHHLKIPVIQDLGGEDRPLSDCLLPNVDYLVPNQLELQRLTGMPTDTEEQVIVAAESLLRRKARNILVTLAERGSILLSADGGVLRQEALPVPGGVVVDGTAAGDAYRAAFAVALVEGHSLQDCMQFAAAAGAIAVSRMGAVPSLPTHSEVLELLGGTWGHNAVLLVRGTSSDTSLDDTSRGGTSDVVPVDGTSSDTVFRVVGTSGNSSSSMEGTTSDTDDMFWSLEDGTLSDSDTETCSTSDNQAASGICSSGSSSSSKKHICPYKFASRLNSMKARRDLLADKQSPASGDNVLGWIARQGQVKGLDLVYLNHPQHSDGVTTKQVLRSLEAANLAAGAVCIRFPAEKYQLGAFSHPDHQVWQSAVDLAVGGCQWAAELGASELVVWSPFDGYDYNFQVDYQATWNRTVAAFQALADRCPPNIKVSLEFKPTDENTRFSVIPSTGAALLLATQVDRPSFGLTLDIGHLLMAGENPAQSVAMVAAAGKLFGVQLNDAHVKLGAEDGLAFGSVNPTMALELIYWLRRVKYEGHIYFDTFPINDDPVREAEFNIRQVKRLWSRAARLADAGIERLSSRHDALGILELLEAES